MATEVQDLSSGLSTMSANCKGPVLGDLSIILLNFGVMYNYRCLVNSYRITSLLSTSPSFSHTIL